MKAAFDNHVGKCVSCLECDSSNRCSVCVLWADTDWATITHRRVWRESMRKRSMPSAALGAPPKRARSESGESPNLEIPLPPLPFSPLPTVPSDIGEIEVASSIPSPCNASTPTPDKFNFLLDQLSSLASLLTSQGERMEKLEARQKAKRKVSRRHSVTSLSLLTRLRLVAKEFPRSGTPGVDDTVPAETMTEKFPSAGTAASSVTSCASHAEIQVTEGLGDEITGPRAPKARHQAPGSDRYQAPGSDRNADDEVGRRDEVLYRCE